MDEAPDDGQWLRVGEVVRLLGRTERAVRKYVSTGQLRSRHMGSQLQIERGSVERLATAQRIDLLPASAKGPAVPGLPPAPPPRPGSVTADRAERVERSFTGLGAWRELAPLVIRAAEALATATDGPRVEVASRARANLLAAVEAIAAGYGGFHTEAKVRRYDEARGLVLAAAADMALLAAWGGPGAEAVVSVARDLETKAARALTGLVRTMERRGRKRRGNGEERDGDRAQDTQAR
jgi:hypothetical protein